MSSGVEPETYREVERKLRVHALYRLPDLAGDAGPEQIVLAVARPPFVLTAEYFDTGDLRLARSGITLRRREGGDDAGWHLKLPTEEQSTRDEIRLPLDVRPRSRPAQPPAELLDLVLGVTRGVTVEPVATLRTDRTAHELMTADGRLVAELTDDSVSVLDAGRVAGKFRELEVESRDGTVDEIDAIVRYLVSSGAVAGGLPPKVVRALGPAATAAPDVVSPSGNVDEHDPAGAALQAHLARHTAALLRQDLRVRRRLPDSVHQLRVAARRLRSGLKVFAPLVDREWATSLAEELAWVAGELGQLRDREVLEERLLRDLAAIPSARPGYEDQGVPGLDVTDARDVAAAISVVRRAFEDEEIQAAASVDAALNSSRYLALLDSLVDAVHSPRLNELAVEPCSRVLPGLVADSWRKLARAVKRLDPQGPDEPWHAVRIRAKRARYAAEAVSGIFGKPARALAEDLENVTELLGDHQDSVIAARTVRRLAAGRRVTGTTGFVLGLLHELEREHARADRFAFAAVWADISDDRGRSRSWPGAHG